MLCDICKIDKLSNEFPSDNVTEECYHPSLICMRCIVKSVKEKGRCPYPECLVQVDPHCKSVEVLEATLAEMFTEYETTYTPQVEPTGGWSLLHVTVLNGESMSIPYSPAMAVLQLKEIIKKEWKHEIAKQKLLYETNELKTYNNGIIQRLSDYNVKPNSTVFLMILLYAIPEAFNHVVFDLYWGYPSSGKDYLDASCLVYQNTICLGVCDYHHRRCHALNKNAPYSILTGLLHSGDIMDDSERRGHHTINVQLKQLPPTVTHLYFTLSAWNSPNISKYPYPSLKFYEASNPNKDLCKTTFSHAGYSEAVVMCSVFRSSEGIWQIFESGKQSAGNAENYGPLDQTVKGLISKGF